MQAKCTTSKSKRLIERHEFAEAFEQNRENLKNNPEIYKKRQAIVEHPFGTIKRQWGFSYIITKKYMKRAEADVGFMFTAYLLRRIINILGIDVLKAYLETLLLLRIAKFQLIKTHIIHFKLLSFLHYLSIILCVNHKRSLKVAYI